MGERFMRAVSSLFVGVLVCSTSVVRAEYACRFYELIGPIQNHDTHATPSLDLPGNITIAIGNSGTFDLLDVNKKEATESMFKIGLYQVTGNNNSSLVKYINSKDMAYGVSVSLGGNFNAIDLEPNADYNPGDEARILVCPSR
jgi:hypothetical protein